VFLNQLLLKWEQTKKNHLTLKKVDNTCDHFGQGKLDYNNKMITLTEQTLGWQTTDSPSSRLWSKN
jgi:hypothetical protein